SFNIAVGFPLLAVLSGGSTNLRNTTRGGVLGGLGLGVLILLLNVGLFATLDQIQGAEMPTVMLAKGLSPWLGWLMMVSLCCMIYSTAVGMFFAFSARFADPETPKFRLISVLSCFVGLGLSFVGFTTLVGTVYPLLGYLGIALIVGVIVYGWRHRHACWPRVIAGGRQAACACRCGLKKDQRRNPDQKVVRRVTSTLRPVPGRESRAERYSLSSR